MSTTTEGKLEQRVSNGTSVLGRPKHQNLAVAGGDGAAMPSYFIGNPKPAHPILSRLETSLGASRSYDHDLEEALGQYLNKSGSEVADKVIETLYGKNGDGVPYFVEKLAPRLGIDLKKLDKAEVDKFIGQYGIIKENLKSLIAAREKFDSAAVSQITTQLAGILFAHLMEGAPAQIANIAYKDGATADDILVKMQEFLRGPNAARSLKHQLKTALTPDRKQGIASGIIEGAYASYKETTTNLYK